MRILAFLSHLFVMQQMSQYGDATIPPAQLSPQAACGNHAPSKLNAATCSAVGANRRVSIGRCGEELVNDFMNQLDDPERCWH
jgi:hypothetical protein